MNDSLLSEIPKHGARWVHFLHRHSWLYPDKLDREPCIVYATGFPSWGAWAQINAALFLAVAADWDDALFADAPAGFQTKAERKERAIAMIRYALGYHSTGDWDGAGGKRWGGEASVKGEHEGYNNWHSPIWLCLLAEAVFAVGDDLPAALRQRFLRAVAHDANRQLEVDPVNFEGDPWAERVKSHPESNAWKASLLTLARSLVPNHENAARWLDLETALFLSSFATLQDTDSEECVEGKPIKDWIFGSHITNEFNAIHHGFLHPCYAIFPLLSRVQSARFCALHGIPYLQAARRHEENVLARVLQLTLPGRVVYPAGKDWPRWVYGQLYLLPVLAHHHASGQGNMMATMQGLLDSRKADAEHADDHSFILARFGRLIEVRDIYAHRYESDAASSLAMTYLVLKQFGPTVNEEKRDRANLSPICVDRTAKTVFEKRSTGIFGASVLSYNGPIQLTATPQANPHLSEWEGNGFLRLQMPHLDWDQRLSVKNWAVEEGERGFVFQATFDMNESVFSGPLYRGVLRAATDPERDRIYIYQQLISNACSRPERIELHRWKFAQCAHNGGQRTISGEGESLVVAEGDVVDSQLAGRHLGIDQSLYLTNARMVQHSRTPVWHVSQNESCREDGFGLRWMEIAQRIERHELPRAMHDETLAESAIVVSFDAITDDVTVDIEADGSIRFCSDGATDFSIPLLS